MANGIGDEQIAINIQLNQNVASESAKAAQGVGVLKQNLAEVNPTLQRVDTGTQQLAQSTKQAQTALQGWIAQLKAAGETNEQIIKTLVGVGVAEGDVRAELNQSTQAVQQNTQAVTQNAQAHQRASTATTGLVNDSRAARAAVAAMTAELALATIVGGQELPESLRKTADGIKEIIDLGIAGGAVGGLPGALIGALAGGAIALATAANEANPDVIALDQSISKLGDHQREIDTLSRISGLTKDAAQSALEDARTNEQLVDSIQRVVDAEKRREEVGPSLARGGGRAASAIGEHNQAVTAANDALDLAKAQLVAASAADITTHAYAELNNELQRDTAKSTTAQLAGLSGESQKASAGFLDFARDHVEVAQKAADLEQKIVAEQAALAALISTGKALPADTAAMVAAIQRWKNELGDLVVNNQKAAEGTDDLSKAQNKLTEAYAEADDKLSALNTKIGTERAQAVQQSNDAAVSAERAYAQAVATDQQNLADRVQDIQQKLGTQLAQDWEKLQDSELDISQRRTDTLAGISQQLADKEGDIASQLAQRVFGIRQDESNRERDLADKREQDIVASVQAEAKAREDLGRKLQEIDAKELQDLRAIDAQKRDSLGQATTEREADRIERDAFQQRLAVQQNADAARTSARQTADDTIREEEKKRAATQTTYEHDIQLAREKANQQVTSAQSASAREQQIAERDAAQDRARAELTATEDRERAERTYREQITQANDAAIAETTIAKRETAEQEASAKQAEANKLEDAESALTARNLAVTASYELERAQIEQTRIKAYESYIQQLQLIGEVALAWQLMYQNLNSNYTPLGQKLFNSGIEDFVPLPKGFASGGQFIADHAQTITVGEGGERELVSVIPESKWNRAGGGGERASASLGIAAQGLDQRVNYQSVFDSVGASFGSSPALNSSAVRGADANTRDIHFSMGDIVIHDATDPQKTWQLVSEHLRTDGWDIIENRIHRELRGT